MRELILLINHSSPIPPYEQINLQFRTLIALGQLVPGQQLPSVRQLARDLDVAPNTIVRAYNELEHDGWVVTSARKGVKVAQKPSTFSKEERRNQITSAVTNLLINAHQLDMSIDEVHVEIDWQQQQFNDREKKATTR